MWVEQNGTFWNIEKRYCSAAQKLWHGNSLVESRFLADLPCQREGMSQNATNCHTRKRC